MLDPFLCSAQSTMLDRTEAGLGSDLALVSIDNGACNVSKLFHEKDDSHSCAGTFQEPMMHVRGEVIPGRTRGSARIPGIPD